MFTKSTRDVQRERIAQSSMQAKTLLFWQLSLAKQGKGPLAGSSTEYAIGLLSDLEAATSWETPLGKAVTDLLDVVIGRPKRKRLAEALDKSHTKYFKKYVPSRNDDDDWDGPSAA